MSTPTSLGFTAPRPPPPAPPAGPSTGIALRRPLRADGPAASEPPGVRAQARAWARSTPGWLRLASIGVALVVVVAVVVAVVVTADRQRAAHQAQVTTTGSLIEAQTIYTSLSAADTAAAAAFLPGASDQAVLEAAYQTQIAQATAGLAGAAQQATPGSSASGPLHVLTTDLPIYTGLVATARANDRAENPVGAAYLSEASNLMDTRLLPAADQLYQAASDRLRGEYRTATDPVPLVVGLLLFVVAIAGLVVLQRRLSRRFRRTLNPALVVATVFTLAAMIWFGFALRGEGRQLDIARHDGSTPIAAFTNARILAQGMRADEELTLVTRDSVATYQPAYDKDAGKLSALLGRTYPDGDVYQPLRDAAGEVPALAVIHRRIRDDDKSGDLQGANQLAVATGAGDLPAHYDRFDAGLDSAVTITDENFVARVTAAQDDLAGIYVGLAILGILATALVLWGVQQRIEEYR